MANLEYLKLTDTSMDIRGLKNSQFRSIIEFLYRPLLGVVEYFSDFLREKVPLQNKMDIITLFQHPKALDALFNCSNNCQAFWKISFQWVAYVFFSIC